MNRDRRQKSEERSDRKDIVGLEERREVKRGREESRDRDGTGMLRHSTCDRYKEERKRRERRKEKAKQRGDDNTLYIRNDIGN